MKTEFVNHQGEHLLVYFAGWGTPPSIVKHLKLPDHTDLLICYQYHDLICNFNFTVYQSIRVVAWSMGVWVAERVMHNYKLLSATAINGTGTPCHAQTGIPPHIFQRTLNKLSPQTRHYFEHRMCLDKTTLSDYIQRQDYREFEDIRTELHFLSSAITNDTQKDLITWQNAIISRNDSIFPPVNLYRYWENRCKVIEYPYAHLLFHHFTEWKNFWEMMYD
ncbi:hypothetical protein V757_01345 [Pelistega indica]|uniref:DUF452 family protein n=1 Tax=Pelistega indica TaxID=1414851 RepID=V8G951_9BURK|nr:MULTISPECIES: pimeloyl-ACP methyl esterase BioG family protein [Pelistega]ETD72945.1 hypothetical protein V757_01345 [Pelistega indica]